MENPPYASLGHKFVQSPSLLDLRGKRGWKIHVGIGLKNESEKRKVVKVLEELINFLKKYTLENKLTFKLASFELMKEFSYSNNPQRGKQITIYIPEENEELVPILVRHLEYFLEKHKNEVYLVKADDRSNKPLWEGGVISIRWSTYLAPQKYSEFVKDEYEREGPWEKVVEYAKKEEKLKEIEKTLKTLEKARYMNRFEVIEAIEKGNFDELKQKIIAVPDIYGGKYKAYFAHLIEDIFYDRQEGRYKVKAKALEGPYAGKIRYLKLDRISREPEKLLKEPENLSKKLTMLVITLPLFLILLFSQFKTTGKPF